MTLWDIVIDAGLLGLLLLIGQLLRAKVRFLQTMVMPASLIGGFIGLLLGPGCFAVLPFSGQLTKYAGVLIAVVFAATPIGDKPLSKNALKGIGGFFFQNTGILILQYAAGMTLALGVLNKLWPSLNDSFGLLLATGFYGGHGTAAAVGAIYKEYGYADFFDLGNASATAGLIGGIICGMIIINWGTRKGYTHYVRSPKELPQYIRTGLIPKKEQKNGSKITISNMSLDPLAFHMALIMIVTMAGKGLSTLIKSAINGLSVPIFVSALIAGYVVQFLLRKSGAVTYVDRYTVQRISSASTDLLVVSAISGLKLTVVAAHIGPLLITVCFGLLLNLLWFLYVSKYASRKDWFERGIMNYGRSNGVIATGVLLSRVVDPEQKSRGLEDTGITDLMNRPIAIALQALPPLFITMGGSYPLFTTLAMWGALILLTIPALLYKWWTPGIMQP